jgi:hypothetical protein
MSETVVSSDSVEISVTKRLHSRLFGIVISTLLLVVLTVINHVWTVLYAF